MVHGRSFRFNLFEMHFFDLRQTFPHFGVCLQLLVHGLLVSHKLSSAFGSLVNMEQQVPSERVLPLLIVLCFDQVQLTVHCVGVKSRSFCVRVVARVLFLAR